MSEKDSTGLVVAGGNLPATATEIRNQVNLIQGIMKEVMIDGVHFGKIPGCGDKPALFKPGAEKLCMTFRLAVSIDSRYVEHDKGHRTYTTIVRLTSPSGRVVGEGVGVCSTLETKYRYRGQQVTMTDRPVPPGYWDLKKTDQKKAQQLLGGPGFIAKKNENNMWVIAETTGEKAEHTDPADYYNTCAKMSKKRAHVDASITTLAASDIFEQDLDEAETGDEIPAGGRSGSGDGRQRPGKDATQQATANLSPEQQAKRQKLVDALTAEANTGTKNLLGHWAQMDEADRSLVGGAFGAIKKIAEKADGGAQA